MYCKNCGKEVYDQAFVCPHCGTRVGDTTTSSQKGNDNVVGLIGFILSFFAPVAGLICSIIGYKNVRDTGGNYKNPAYAGIIISAVSIGLYVIAMIVYLIVFFTVLLPALPGMTAALL